MGIQIGGIRQLFLLSARRQVVGGMPVAGLIALAGCFDAPLSLSELAESGSPQNPAPIRVSVRCIGSGLENEIKTENEN